MKVKITLLYSLFVGFLTAQSWQDLGLYNQFGNVILNEFEITKDGIPVTAHVTNDIQNEIQVNKWENNSWVSIVPIDAGAIITDIEFVTNENELYIAYAVAGFGNGVTLLKYDGVSSWESVGSSEPITNTDSYQSGSLRLSISELTNDLSFMIRTNSPPSQPQTFQFDGANWLESTSLNTHFNTPQSNDALENKFFTSGVNSYYLSHQDQTSPVLDELYLHHLNEDLDSWSITSGGTIIVNPILFDITGHQASGEPRISYSSQDNQDVIRTKYILGAAFDDKPPYSNPNVTVAFTDLSIAVDKFDQIYIASIDAGSKNRMAFFNGSLWQDLGEIGPSDITTVDVEIFQESNKSYVMYNTTSGFGIRTFNNSPSVISPVINNICQDVGLSEVVGNLNLTDQDHDSVYIVSVISSDQTVLPNSNITVTRTIPYLSTSNENHYKIEVIPSVGQSGSVALTVTYSDGFGDQIETISMIVNATPIVANNGDFIICESQSVTLIGSGAATYLWDNGITNGSPYIPASAGTYNYILTGTDVNGCVGITSSNVTVNPLPTFNTTANDILCFGSANGEIILDGLSTSNAYTIQYDYNLAASVPVTHLSDVNGDIILNLLAEGNYENFVAIDNASGCSSLIGTGSYSISEPSQITISGEANQVHCENTALILNGNAFGGTGTLVYSWDNGVIDGSPFTPNVGNNIPYTLTATDDNGCNTSNFVLNITINSNPAAFTTSQNDPTTCGGIDGNITLIGLIPSTSYDVSYNDGLLQGPIALTTDASGNILISGLNAGSYSSFNVVNTNGCSIYLANSISLSDPGSPFVNPINDQVICSNSNFNTTSFTGSVGAIYTWNNDNTSIGLAANGNGDIIGFTGLNSLTPQEISTVIVTPTLAGCTGASETFTFTVDALDDADFSYSQTNLCEAGLNPTININLPGGSFSYSAVTGPPFPNLTLGSTTGLIDISTSQPGDFTVLYTTSGTCSNSSSQNIIINATPLITITQPVLNICNNASPINMLGIATPIGGNYLGDGFVNNIFDPIALAVNLYGYTYSYTDANGCSASDNGSVNIFEIPTINLTLTHTTCGNSTGTAISNVTGGLIPYNYYWSNGISGTQIDNLSSGTYYLNLTDNNNCYVMDVAAIQIASIDITSYSIVNNICAGDNNASIDLNLASTADPYTYYWSNGQTTQEISNLYSGQYEVFVTDSDGCMSAQSIILSEQAQMKSEITTTNPSSCGTQDGSLSVSISGGTPGYSYNWTNSIGTTIGTTAVISNIGEGVYTLLTTDFLGCTHISHAQLSETGGPEITAEQITPANCSGNGIIDISITSLNTIQSIIWSNSETTEDISGLTPGLYSVSVLDVNGCSGNLEMALYPDYPDYTEVCMVTVDTNTNTNLVIWEKPIATDIDYFIVYRETSVAGHFSPVDTIQYEDESAFTDPIAYPQFRSWRYKLSTVNNCGIESVLSPVHKTMHITIAQGSGGTYNINWDNYEGFTFPTFDLYRYTDLNGWELISTLSNNTFTYTDTPPSEIGLDYMISITPPITCTSTKDQDHNATRSNTTSSGILAPGSGSTDGLLELELEDLVLIYPNPSTSLFNINLNSEIVEIIIINIYDMRGTIIQSFEVVQSDFIIDLKDFESGIYILEVNSGDSIVRKQLVKK